MQHTFDKEEIGFFGALFGLVTQPAETTQTLLAHDSPRHAFSLLFSVALVFFGPFLFYMFKYGPAIYRPQLIYGFTVFLVLSVLLFVLIESILLLITGLDFSFTQLFAIIAYSLAPLVAFFLLVYVFNYMSVGSISMVNLLVNPKTVMADKFMKILPYAMLIAEANVLIVFAYSIKVVGGLHMPTAIILTAFSILPLTVAVYVGLYFADQISPGLKEGFLSLLNAPSALLQRRY